MLQTGRLPKDGKAIPFVSDFFDFSIYLDADENVLQDWYVNRFLTLRGTAFRDPKSYFHRYCEFVAMRKRSTTALSIWERINLLNLLREHPADPAARRPDPEKGSEPPRSRRYRCGGYDLTPMAAQAAAEAFPPLNDVSVSISRSPPSGLDPGSRPLPAPSRGFLRVFIKGIGGQRNDQRARMHTLSISAARMRCTCISKPVDAGHMHIHQGPGHKASAALS